MANPEWIKLSSTWYELPAEKYPQTLTFSLSDCTWGWRWSAGPASDPQKTELDTSVRFGPFYTVEDAIKDATEKRRNWVIHDREKEE